MRDAGLGGDGGWVGWRRQVMRFAGRSEDAGGEDDAEDGENS